MDHTPTSPRCSQVQQGVISTVEGINFNDWVTPVYKQGQGDTGDIRMYVFRQRKILWLPSVLLINLSKLNMRNLKTNKIFNYRQYKILTVDGKVV